MTPTSANAKHKLFIAGLLLTLFALPFAIAWQRGMNFHDQAVLAGGATIGKMDRAAVHNTPAKTTNNVGQIAGTAGGDFIGDMTQ